MIKNKIVIIVCLSFIFLITFAQEKINVKGKNNQTHLDSPLVLEDIDEVYLFTKDDNQSLDYKFYNKSDTNYIDSFAYHAHGYGSESEKAGYDKNNNNKITNR